MIPGVVLYKAAESRKDEVELEKNKLYVGAQENRTLKGFQIDLKARVA